MQATKGVRSVFTVIKQARLLRGKDELCSWPRQLVRFAPADFAVLSGVISAKVWKELWQPTPPQERSQY